MRDLRVEESLDRSRHRGDATPVIIAVKEETTLRVAVVTDATASLPAEWVKAWGITVLPLPVQFGADTFLDGVHPVREFYEKLATGLMPTTSTPSPGAFLEHYKALLADGVKSIVSIHVMSTKSSVLQTAKLAAEMLPQAKIYPVDSGSVSLGLGLLVRAAARWACQGLSGAEVAARAQEAARRIKVWAAMPSLTALRRSGRVSLGQALIGGLLSIKPVLEMHQGVIQVVDKVRTWPRAVSRMVDLAQGSMDGDAAELAVVHTAAPEAAAALAERLRSLLPSLGEKIPVMEAGPALASHAGPGALGICLYQPGPVQHDRGQQDEENQPLEGTGANRPS